MLDVNEQRRNQLRYIGLTEEDLHFLSRQRKRFERITDAVVDQLYDNIYANPELARIIDNHTTIERLKETQRWYFMTMTIGKIDMEFIERRLHIGKIHSRIGLTTDWYLGTYMRYLDIAVQHFRKDAPEEWTGIILALSKMFNFDSQLVLEAYEQEEQQKVQSLYEERESTLARVNQAVQRLAAMIVELNENSRTVSGNAAHAADVQEQAHRKVGELHGKIEEIREVGSILQEISEQTHLLGLNAAIEAAHANEYGRGFGLVANEIRKLAAHSKESLESIKKTLADISELLTDVKADSETAVSLARSQAASSQELTAFAGVLEQVTAELENMGGTEPAADA